VGARRAVRAFLDASALVKLIHAERESEALVDELASWRRLVSSALGELELWVVGRRLGVSETRIRRVVAGLDLVPVTAAVLTRARERQGEPLRTLDAVHLASALEVRDGIGAFLAYDRRLCAAAGEAGLDVQSPGA